jgi:hypothetical protein
MKFPCILTTALILATSYNGFSQKSNITQPGFAVVELFTSEGCSSCPSAEAALSKINDAHQQGVYVLEYHVDYWNHLGWKDEYSSHDYTLRQQRYAEIMHNSGTYTPQAVVNGKREMVGSDQQKLNNAINSFLSQPQANNIKIAATGNNNGITIDYSTTNLNGQILNIALVQKNVESNVKRGENSGRKLKHTNVVRGLEIIDNEKTTGKTHLSFPPGTTAKNFMIIAYTQEKSNWATTGSATCAIN